MQQARLEPQTFKSQVQGVNCLATHASMLTLRGLLDVPKFKVALNLFQSVFLYSVAFTVVVMGVPIGRFDLLV